jgi:hypothetical protein
MLHECFGVPVLRSYTAEQIHKLFSVFKEVEVKPSGSLAYLWIIKGRK